MSWNIAFIGKPENVATALQQHSEKLDGQSKVEFDNALPHIIGLVNQNYGQNVHNIKVLANGHGVKNGEHSYGSCQVNIEFIAGTIV